MRKKGMALLGAMAVVVAAAEMPVTPVASQEFGDHSVSSVLPVETNLEEGFEALRTDGARLSVTVEAFASPESDLGGGGCLDEDGGISLDASNDHGAAQHECPKYVVLDHFTEVDYGPNAVGVTFCRLTEQYTATEGHKFVGKIAATIKAIFTGKLEGESWRETERERCQYYGCDLDLSMSEATWSAQR